MSVTHVLRALKLRFIIISNIYIEWMIEFNKVKQFIQILANGLDSSQEKSMFKLNGISIMYYIALYQQKYLMVSIFISFVIYNYYFLWLFINIYSQQLTIAHTISTNFHQNHYYNTLWILIQKKKKHLIFNELA